MGILDNWLNSPLTLLGAGLSSQRNLGDGLLAAMQIMQNKNETARLAKSRDMEDKIRQMQLDEAMRKDSLNKQVVGLLGQKGDFNGAGPLLPGQTRGTGLLGGEITQDQFDRQLLPIMVAQDPGSYMQLMAQMNKPQELPSQAALYEYAKQNHIDPAVFGLGPKQGAGSAEIAKIQFLLANGYNPDGTPKGKQETPQNIKFDENGQPWGFVNGQFTQLQTPGAFVSPEAAKLKVETAQKQQERNAEYSNAVASIDNLDATVQRILETPQDVMRSAHGPVDTYFPTLNPKVADYEELVNTLKSQSFLAMIPTIKGTGQLSDAEGKKLESALQSLSLRQSPQRMMENLLIIKNIMATARENLNKKYSTPSPRPSWATPETAQGGR